MNKSVLLTRSYLENRELEQILISKGYECINCSMIEYEDILFDYSILNNVKNIIITSKYAAHLIKIARPNQCTFVVGQNSARILRSKNYQVNYVAANALELKNYFCEIQIEGIYLAGNHITIEMPPEIKKYIFYKVNYTGILSYQELIRLRKGIDYILLYSENCAKTLIKLILEYELLKYLENSVVITISSKVESIIKPYFKNSFVSKEPDQMIKFLENYDRKKQNR